MRAIRTHQCGDIVEVHLEQRAIIIYLHSEHVCAVLRQLNDNFNSAMHKQNTL